MENNRSPFKNRIEKIFTNNIFLKLIALVVGIVLWGLLSNANDPVITRNLSVPINYQYEDKLKEDESLVVVSAPENVSISVSYRQSDASRVSAGMFYCSADLVNHVGGDLSSQRVYITVTQLAGQNIIVDWSYQKNDPTITVSMDEYITKTFTVEFLPENSLTEGLILDNSVTFTPSEITISGPKSEFSNLAHVKAPVNMQDLSKDGGGTINLSVPVYLYDSNDNVIVNSRLSMSHDEVTLSAVVQRITNVNVRLGGVTGEPAEGFRYLSSSIDPETLTVSGLKSSVADLTDISIPAEAIDITGITEDTDFEIDITPYLPEGVELTGTDPMVTVTVFVEAVETKVIQIPSSDIRTENERDGYLYLISGSTIQLRVSGFEEDLEVLNVSSLNPTVDVGSLEEGRYRVQVKINQLTGYVFDNADSIYTYVDVTKEPTSSEETQMSTHGQEESSDQDESENSSSEITESQSDSGESSPEESTSGEETQATETTEEPSGFENESEEETEVEP